VIRAVVFDIGNVVCAFHPDRRLRALATRTGLEPEQIHDAIWASGLDGRAESGELSPVDTERLLIDALERRIDAVGLREAWSTAFAIDPRVRDIVATLERPAFAFTNNGPLFTVCLAHELAPIARMFERVICSWQVGARKPDPTAFGELCREVGHLPEELVFVDDRRDNVESARTIGCTAIAYTSALGLAAELRRLHVAA
jgi:glucose-1-phosphatase